LFFEEKEKDENKEHATHFLDALDIIEFRKGETVVEMKQKNGDKEYELRDKEPSEG
jgi:hypothetical protein